MLQSYESRVAFLSGALTAVLAVTLVANIRRRQPSLSAKKSCESTLDSVCVTSNRLNTEAMVASVGSPGAGAIVTFSGVTRDNFNGKSVVRLEYEGYVDMAEREMSKIVKQMRDQWELERVSIAHRTGVCPVGEASVIIAVSSAHRKEALEAAHFAIDTLKATVPIWKKEFYENDSTWKQNAEWHESRK